MPAQLIARPATCAQDRRPGRGRQHARHKVRRRGPDQRRLPRHRLAGGVLPRRELAGRAVRPLQRRGRRLHARDGHQGDGPAASPRHSGGALRRRRPLLLVERSAQLVGCPPALPAGDGPCSAAAFTAFAAAALPSPLSATGPSAAPCSAAPASSAAAAPAAAAAAPAADSFATADPIALSAAECTEESAEGESRPLRPHRRL